MAEDFEVGGLPPEESSNRTFLYAAGGIGLLILISIGCLAGYVLFLQPQQLAARNAERTQIALQNTEVAAQITQTAGARFPSPTTPPTRTPAPTNTATPTQVVVVASPTATVAPSTLDPAQATAAAQATLLALTPSPTVTALPTTGFADEGGFPMLIVLAGVLVAVVVVARRMRMRPVA
ncbi:MAG TPA: hypothetical protein VLL77_08375 [Anaerolineales bacterium]|nr:hypothetical protein [Anaerolineales bacterium]